MAARSKVLGGPADLGDSERATGNGESKGGPSRTPTSNRRGASPFRHRQYLSVQFNQSTELTCFIRATRLHA